MVTFYVKKMIITWSREMFRHVIDTIIAVSSGKEWFN